ncbi:MAG: isopentenyl phosphate kinase [Patescibacteria group bacterium]
MKHSVLLIKLGGSIITNKDIPMSLRVDILKRLVNETARARQELAQQKTAPLLVVGHGQGSFAHVPATQYKTMNGFINNESPMGMAIVQDSAAQLNRLVIQEFLEAGIPAVSLYASNCLVTASRKPVAYFTEVFEQYLKHGLFPVTCGDVIVDTKQGCTIWSTEEILSFFAQKFQKKGWKVNQIIHVVEVDGVYDLQKHLIPNITKENWQEVKKAITATKGFDVTGGMGLKVEESLALAELGIASKIISGLKEDNLYNALIGKPSIGTEIS